MQKRKITQIDREIITEIYHKYPDKDITVEMLLEARKETGLGFQDIKKVLRDYINFLNVDMNA